jgi:hypothetical protein
MYLPDMSIYPNALGSPNLRAIGWLDIEHEFPRGVTPQPVINTLKQIIVSKRDVNKMRGFHLCEFCASDMFGEKYMPDSKEDFRNYSDKTTVYIENEDKKILLGMSEIWIPSPSHIIYAAPSLIYHYITVHHYLPPQDFLDAVQSFDVESEWNGDAEVEKWLTRKR